MAAVTNCHGHGGWKQHKFMNLHFGRSESSNQDVGKAGLFLEVLRKNLLPCLADFEGLPAFLGS